MNSNYPAREWHKAVCADCGKECEVPFRPTGDRPVYCQECWVKRRQTRRTNYNWKPNEAVWAQHKD